MNKKNLVLIAGASMLVLGVPAISMAQTPAASGPFADVPADHWAYQAVDTLQKAGIVIGYPDGTYGGKRAMTRYEFAVAIARLLPLIQNAGNGNYATKDDLAALRQDLESKLQANSDAIDALRKLVDEFQPELEKLGQDVAAVNDRLNALEARVAAVEEEQRRVRFTGALNLIAEAANITRDTSFVDENGSEITGGKQLFRNTDVYQDFLLGIQGHVSDTATANVKLDFGNYLSSLGNAEAFGGFNASSNIYDSHYNGTGATTFTPGGSVVAQNDQVTLYEANLEAPVKLGPLGGADAVVGRFGEQWTKWTLRETDADVYTNLYQTDSGNIITDGGKLDFNLGPVRLDAYAGQFQSTPYFQPYGGAAMPLIPGTGGGPLLNAQRLPQGLIAADAAAPLTQGAGARATFGNPNNWVLGASFQTFGLGDQIGSLGQPVDPNTGKTYGGLSVYGLDFNGAIPLIGRTGLTLDANWNVSAEATKPYDVNDVGNNWRYQSTDDELGYNFGALSIKGGYQYVGPDYTAPGYWERLGSWTNPTNVSGGVASAKYTFSHSLSLNADYEGFKAAYGTNADGSQLASPLRQGDDLDHYQVGLAYGLTSAYNVDLGYEESLYNLKNQGVAGYNPNTDLLGAGKPTQQFINIGLGHNISSNASVKLLYQIGEYRNKGTGFYEGGDGNGNVAVGQFSCKF